MACPCCGSAAPLRLDPEFHALTRGTRTFALSMVEFRCLEALQGAKRPLYADYLREQVGSASDNALAITLTRLRKKIAALGVVIVSHRGSGGEPSAYSLSISAMEAA